MCRAAGAGAEPFSDQTTRPYCFSLPDRSHINQRDPTLGDNDWCDRCLAFIDCQKAYDSRPKILTLHLKDQYFTEILNGSKIEEYREAKSPWNKLIPNRHYDVIELCKRYPPRGDIKNRIWFKYAGYRLEIIDWYNGDIIKRGQTFVLPLNERLDYPYQAIEQRRDVPALSQ